MTSSSRDGKDAERRLIELSDLLEISQTLNQSLELDAILNHLLLASMGRFAIGRGCFLLADAPGGFRVAIVNCWDRAAGYAARDRLRAHFEQTKTAI